MEKQKRYYSVKEAAKIIGVSTNTIYKYLDEGSLKGRRLNSRGRFKIPFPEIAPYLAEKETVKTYQEVPSSPRGGGLPVLGIAFGVILGIISVNYIPALIGSDSAELSLAKEIAQATWEYSGRTSTKVGDLALSGGAGIASGTQEVSRFLASKVGTRKPEVKEEAPKQEPPANFVLVSVPADSSVNLQEEAEDTSKVVAKLAVDEVAEKTGEEGEWSQIAINGFPSAWVKTSYLETSPEAVSQVLGSAADFSGKKVIILDTPTGWLRVRAAPGGDEITKVFPGEILGVIDQSGDWYFIEVSPELTGWISSQYAVIQAAD